MRKTTVYLPEELKRRLERAARRQRRSEADIVRDALAEALAHEEPPRPVLPLFTSDNPILVDQIENELAAGFGR